MSEENYKVQWSVSLPPAAQYAKGDMLNIRGESSEEVEQLFDEIIQSEFVEKATEVANLIRLAAGVGADVKQDAGASAHGHHEPDQTRQDEPAPLYTCVHGKRTYRTGNGKKGKWEAYFCPQPKGASDQCDPVWVD